MYWILFIQNTGEMSLNWWLQVKQDLLKFKEADCLTMSIFTSAEPYFSTHSGRLEGQFQLQQNLLFSKTGPLSSPSMQGTHHTL